MTGQSTQALVGFDSRIKPYHNSLYSMYESPDHSSEQVHNFHILWMENEGQSLDFRTEDESIRYEWILLPSEIGYNNLTLLLWCLPAQNIILKPKDCSNIPPQISHTVCLYWWQIPSVKTYLRQIHRVFPVLEKWTSKCHGFPGSWQTI